MRLIFVYRSEDKGVVPWGSRLEHKAALPDQLPFHIHNGGFVYLSLQEDVEACGRATESVPPCAHTCTRMVNGMRSIHGAARFEEQVKSIVE